MKEFIVSFRGHGWVWSDRVKADTSEEAQAIAESFLGKGEIITHIAEA